MDIYRWIHHLRWPIFCFDRSRLITPILLVALPNPKKVAIPIPPGLEPIAHLSMSHMLMASSPRRKTVPFDKNVKTRTVHSGVAKIFGGVGEEERNDKATLTIVHDDVTRRKRQYGKSCFHFGRRGMPLDCKVASTRSLGPPESRKVTPLSNALTSSSGRKGCVDRNCTEGEYN